MVPLLSWGQSDLLEMRTEKLLRRGVLAQGRALPPTAQGCHLQSLRSASGPVTVRVTLQSGMGEGWGAQNHPRAEVLLVGMRIAGARTVLLSRGPLEHPTSVGMPWDPGTCIFNKLPSCSDACQKLRATGSEALKSTLPHTSQK